MSFFEHVPMAPPDPIFGLTAEFFADPREQKVNLGVGYYKDEMLRTPILKSVKEAERIILESEPNKEYLPIEGHGALIDKVGELVFGEKFWETEKGRIAGCQTIGGTGALKIAGTFCKEEFDKPLFLPSMTWPNHRGVFKACRLHVEDYPYYDEDSHVLAFDALCVFLEKCERKSIILLHAICHNPTGIDPSLEEWKRIASIMDKKELVPFFDFAYQGLGMGIDEDAAAVRYFAERGFEMFVAFSAAKNFSLYGERVGALFIVSKVAKTKEHILSRVKQMIRTNYSNPPRHGAELVAHILCDADLKNLWKEELDGMLRRIQFVRRELVDRLNRQAKMHNFTHLKNGHGMFCCAGLDELQVNRLRREGAIYMPLDGRINVCGLNENNLDYVVESIVKVS
jgi:aspartate aminotransferase